MMWIVNCLRAEYAIRYLVWVANGVTSVCIVLADRFANANLAGLRISLFVAGAGV